ncbi:MAG: DinB family protein [Candidatus Dormibacteraeota bacterium]|nr:DinB family protein [Candidatus Dormibacteraeota bacterium]
MTRDEVLAALEETRIEIDARLRPESAERFGTWSAKDLLFHIAAWEHFYGATLRTRRESGREATAAELLGRPLEAAEADRLMALDTDETNAYLEELFQGEDWPTATKFWREAHASLVDEVGKLTDEQLAAGEKEPLWRRIGLESFSHAAGHLSGPE